MSLSPAISGRLLSQKTRIWVEAALLFAIALIVRLHLITDVPRLEYPPSWDELYHIFAARSWIADGTLGVADGEYRRAFLYTVALGHLFQVFSESLTLARSFSALADSLLVVAVFLWTRAVAGSLGAWIAAGALCAAPIALFQAQFIRFYAWHGLMFWLGAIGIYALFVRRRAALTTVAIGGATLACLALALHLQLITVIGLCGLALWTATELRGIVLSPAVWRPGIRWVVLIGLGGAVMAGAVAFKLGAFDTILYAFTWLPPNLSLRGDLRYYHWLLLYQYPTFWTLLPIAVLIGIARKPRPALFCTCVLGVGLLVHSLATAKSERYIYYLLPFFFALWGIALAETLPQAKRLVAQALAQFVTLRPGHPFSWTLGLAFSGLATVFVLLSNPGFPRAYKMLQGGPVTAEGGTAIYWWREAPNWAAAAEILQPMAADVDVVVATNSLLTLYYLDRYDVDLSRNRRLHFGAVEDKEFGLDQRTGRPVITTAESLRLVAACVQTGLIVSPTSEWRGLERRLGADLNRIVEQAEKVPLPEAWRLQAYSWKHATPPAAADCSSLPKRLREVSRRADQSNARTDWPRPKLSE